jgi:restriction endonuclease Mrr
MLFLHMVDSLHSGSKIAQELHDKLSPVQFEKLVYVLLGEMGFEDVELTGRSGDGEIDLKAAWTQSQVPGL